MTDPHSETPSSADDEPETPVWLPALGFALFVVGGVAWAVTPPAVSATPPPIAAPSVAPAPPPPPPQAQQPQAAPPSPPPTATAPTTPPPFAPHPGGGPKLRLGTPGTPGALIPRPAKNHP